MQIDTTTNLRKLTPSIAAVIINYNGFADTVECINSLSRSQLAPSAVYVIDNGSTDGSGRRLLEFYEQTDTFPVKVFCSKENLGFGGANNYIMREVFSSGYDYALLLNNDTEVEPDMLGSLVLASSDYALASPLILYYGNPEVIWYAGGFFDKWGVPRHEHMGERLNDLRLVQHKVQWATGCCVLVPRTAFFATGGFDERFFLYWEDADWAIRLNRAGFEIKFVPESVLYHKVSASTGGEDSPLSYYYNTRNRLFAIRKLGLSKKTWLWARLGLIRGVLSTKPQYSFALDAWRDYCVGRMGKK